MQGIIFQLDAQQSKSSLFSAHQTEMTNAREETERFIGNLEKNLDLVLSATMLDPVMETLRLRMFLENFRDTISETRY